LDNVTHSLFAVTLARTALGRAGRGTLAALVVASNIPDIDIVATARGGVNYLRWHRGPTHGPLGIVGLGFAAAAVVWLAYRIVDRRGRPPDAPPDAPFHMLVVLGMIGVVLHILMDLPTSYGTRVLSPFDWHWFAVDWMPIVDVYLLMVLVAMLGFGRPSAEMHRRKAAIALVFMAANYGVRGVAHHEALVLAPRLFGPTLPRRCDPQEAAGGLLDRWPRPQADASGLEPGRRCLMEIAAMPSYTSPFRWRIVARMSNKAFLYIAFMLLAVASGAEVARGADLDGIVVLQTDFGLKDQAVAAMRGVIRTVDQGLTVDDLTHEIVFDRLLADMHARGVAVAEPTDPLHDRDFIRALIATYSIKPTTDWATADAA